MIVVLVPPARIPPPCSAKFFAIRESLVQINDATVGPFTIVGIGVVLLLIGLVVHVMQNRTGKVKSRYALLCRFDAAR